MLEFNLQNLPSTQELPCSDWEEVGVVPILVLV
jgi:hypothetical protein